jgi:hypothetical protein
MANRRHKRATSQAAQENRRGADTIGQAAQAAAALGEEAARASGNAARMAVEASEHAARAGADLFESTAGGQNVGQRSLRCWADDRPVTNEKRASPAQPAS